MHDRLIVIASSRNNNTSNKLLATSGYDFRLLLGCESTCCNAAATVAVCFKFIYGTWQYKVLVHVVKEKCVFFSRHVRMTKKS